MEIDQQQQELQHQQQEQQQEQQHHVQKQEIINNRQDDAEFASTGQSSTVVNLRDATPVEANRNQGDITPFGARQYAGDTTEGKNDSLHDGRDSVRTGVYGDPFREQPPESQGTRGSRDQDVGTLESNAPGVSHQGTPLRLPDIHQKSPEYDEDGNVKKLTVSQVEQKNEDAADDDGGGWDGRTDEDTPLSKDKRNGIKPKRAILHSTKGKMTKQSNNDPSPEPYSSNFSIQNGRVSTARQQYAMFKDRRNKTSPRTNDHRSSPRLPQITSRTDQSSGPASETFLTTVQRDTLTKRRQIALTKTKAKLSKSEANFVRLAKMVTRVGADLIRLTFYKYLDNQHPPKKLHQFLSANKRRLKSHATTYKLISRRWDMMYPDDDETKANLQQLDAPLIFWFLRYICHLKRPNDFIWKRKPATDDFTETGDVARIRDFRNYLLNLSVPAVYDDEFQRKVQQFTQITVRICGERQGSDVQTVIDGMKTEAVRYSEREQYVSILQQWAGETADRVIAPSILSAEAVRERKEITRQFLESNRNPQVFVRTKAYQKALDKMAANGSVVIKGNSGDGKTTLSIALMVSEFDEDECLLITSPEQWHNIEPRSVSVLLFDDMFGSGSFDEQLFQEWEPKFNLIHEVTMATKEGQRVQVIITIRHHILQQCISKLSAYKLFAEDRFIDCSSSELTSAEKRSMLGRHLVADKKTLMRSEIDKSSKVHNSRLGYPQCCALYVSKPHFLIMGSQFFERPVDSLFDTIDRMYDGDKYGYLGMAIMMFQKDGILFRHKLQKFDEPGFRDKFLDLSHLCSIPSSDHIHKFTLNALQNQMGSFVHYHDDRDCFTFSHESVMEAMMTSFGERHPQQVLEGCSLQFLMDVVGTTYVTYDETTDEIFIMRVKPHNFSVLARVLEHYLRRGEVKRVSQHRSLRDTTFLQFFFDFLNQADDMTSLLLKEDNHYQEKGDRRRVGFLYGAVDQEVPNVQLVAAILKPGIHTAGTVKVEWSSAEMEASLCLTVRKGSYDIYKLLVDAGVAPPDELFYEEQYLTSVGIVRDLLKRRHWSSEQKDVAVVRAARGTRAESIEILTLLLQEGAAINSIRVGTTALCEAAKSGKTKTLNLLLNSGASVMDRDGTQQTPLHHACDWNNIEVVKTLLKKNADVNARDALGFSPLLVVAGWGRETILDLLLTKRVDPLAMDTQENTVLHICSANGQAKIMKTMIEKFPSEMKSILITRNRHGWTPLDFALRCGHFGATKVLIQQIVNTKSLKTQSRTFVHTRFYVVKLEDFDLSERYQYRFLDLSRARTCFQMPRGNWFIQAGNREEYEQVRLFAQKYEGKLRQTLAKS